MTLFLKELVILFFKNKKQRLRLTAVDF